MGKYGEFLCRVAGYEFGAVFELVLGIELAGGSERKGAKSAGLPDSLDIDPDGVDWFCCRCDRRGVTPAICRLIT